MTAEVSTMSDSDVFWSLLAMGACCLFVFGGLTTIRDQSLRRRAIGDTPLAAIRSALPGYAKLSGKACGHSGLVDAHLSGRPCVWYRYRVEEWRGSGGDDYWVSIASGSSPNLIVLDDGSGRCILDLDNADVRPSQTREWKGPYRDPNQPIPLKWYQSREKYRYREEWIDEGETLYCLGHLTSAPHGPSRLAAVRESQHLPMIVFAGNETSLVAALRSETFYTVLFCVYAILLISAAVLSNRIA
jgi:hypothetical protein